VLSTDLSADRVRTYRSREQLVVCVAAVVVVDALNLNAIHGGGQGTALLVGTVLFSILFTVAGLRAGLSSLTAREDGIRVSNAFSSFGLKWSEIERFEVGRWMLLPYVCLIRLKDGRTMHSAGVQEARIGNGWAEEVVDDLNAELAKRTGVGSNQPQVAVDSR
jgi:hypothetical protein